MPLLLVAAFVLVPIVEIWAITQVAQLISWPWTLVSLLVASIVGGWLLRREGARAWRRFQEALRAHRLPAVEVVDGALIIFGGALLLTPGFLTDVVGLLCVLPPTRAALNAFLRRVVLARTGWLGAGAMLGGRLRGRGDPTGRGAVPEGTTAPVRGAPIDVAPTEPSSGGFSAPPGPASVPLKGDVRVVDVRRDPGEGDAAGR